MIQQVKILEQIPIWDLKMTKDSIISLIEDYWQRGFQIERLILNDENLTKFKCLIRKLTEHWLTVESLDDGYTYPFQFMGVLVTRSEDPDFPVQIIYSQCQ
jgi:hypothetical protein